MAASALALAQPLSASPPAAASGGGVEFPSPPTDVRVADGNVFFKQAPTGTLTGAFAGTFTAEISAVIHPGGDINFHGFITLTGTTPCGPGTVVFHVEGKGDFATLTFEGRFATVDQGTTVPVHAVLSFVQVGAPFTYSGRAHCDP